MAGENIAYRIFAADPDEYDRAECEWDELPIVIGDPKPCEREVTHELRDSEYDTYGVCYQHKEELKAAGVAL